MRTEFDFINDIKSRFGLSKVGDDCAVLPKDDKTDLLITSDMLVENVDFRLEWATPEQVGYKALAVSVSDIAAMGGTPLYAMLSIAIVENLWKGDLLDRLYTGWHRAAREHGIELIGGDVSGVQGPLVIDSTVLGEVPKGGAVLRSGAKPGDGIFVTGTLGRAAGGLQLMEGRVDPSSASDREYLAEGVLTPVPNVRVANLLRERCLANSMIDLSDGLSSDLTHLCTASGVGAEIEADLLPVEPVLRSFFPSHECLEMALNGGEDFQLLFTADPDKIANPNIAEVTRIGTITSLPGVIELIWGATRKRIDPRGYRHF